MAQRTNFATMSDGYLHMFSNYNVADHAIETITKAWKERKSELDSELAKALESNDTAEVVKITNMLKSEEADTKKAKEPHTRAKKEAMKAFPETMHAAYVLATVKGDFSAYGEAVVRGRKNTDTTYKVARGESFRDCMKAFMQEAGIYSPTDKTTDKTVARMLIACGGVKKQSYVETGARVGMKSASQFNEIVVRAFLDSFIENNAAFDIAADGTISRHDFSVADAE